MKFFTRKRSIIGLIAVVAVAAMAFGAYAYFTSTGHGTGTATVGSVPAGQFAVTTDAATGPALLPTGLGSTNASIDTIAYHVQNTTESNLNVNAVDVSVDAALLPSGCHANDFSINGATAGTTVHLTPNVDLNPISETGNTYSSSVTLQMVDNHADQTPCQGATVTLNFDAS